MKIIITALGSGGDVFPFIVLGQALQQRGHTVVLMANPHFADAVDQAGLSLAPLGTESDYLAFLQQPGIWDNQSGFRLIWRYLIDLTPRILAAIEEYIIPGKTVLIGSTLSLATRLAQERHDLPATMIHLAPHCFLSAHAFPVTSTRPLPGWLPLWARWTLLTVMDRLLIDATCAKSLNAVRTSLDLPPVRSVMRRWLHSPDLTIGAFPAWFAAPQPDWPPSAIATGFLQRHSPADNALPDSVQAFLDAGEPPLLFTPGTGMVQARAFFACAVQTVAQLERRALFVTGFSENLPDRLPPTILTAAYLPFDQLLPKVAAIIHHGGIGTVAAGLAAGIPQLVIPFAFDQFDNAVRVTRLGVGRNCAGLNPDHWAGALRELLHPDSSLTTAVRRCQRLMAEAPDIGVLIADRIEALAATRLFGASTQNPGLFDE